MPDRDTYTHGHQDAVLRSHRSRTAANSAAYLLPHLRVSDRILDVGCGPGTLTVDLGRHVPDGEVVGIDVSAEVVDEAKGHAQEARVHNVSFLAGDFRDIASEVGSFDVVHAHQVLQHLRDPVGALAAMAASARPGGIVAARDSDYSAFTWAPANPNLDRWLEVYLAVTSANGAEANAGRWLLRWAHAAGLTDATYSSSTWTWATPETRSWWADLWADRCLTSSFAQQAVDYGVATAEELASMADGWRGWADAPDATFIVVHGEVLARVPR